MPGELPGTRHNSTQMATPQEKENIHAKQTDPAPLP